MEKVVIFHCHVVERDLLQHSVDCYLNDAHKDKKDPKDCAEHCQMTNGHWQDPEEQSYYEDAVIDGENQQETDPNPREKLIVQAPFERVIPVFFKVDDS